MRTRFLLDLCWLMAIGDTRQTSVVYICGGGRQTLVEERVKEAKEGSERMREALGGNFARRFMGAERPAASGDRGVSALAGDEEESADLWRLTYAPAQSIISVVHSLSPLFNTRNIAASRH
uniref:Secreted protein n=1 Tax=Plectus sambesii TaxID=2011161 RepID=A0A914W1H1_9BILA